MPFFEQYRGVIQANIDRAGQHLVAVFPGDEEPGFAYTVGNAGHGLPELLILGNFAPSTMGGILNDLGRRMRSAGQPLDGEISLGGSFPVRIQPAGRGAVRRYTLMAGRYLGHDRYSVLQVLFCDPFGIFPGEPGCDPRYDVPFA